MKNRTKVFAALAALAIVAAAGVITVASAHRGSGWSGHHRAGGSDRVWRGFGYHRLMKRFDADKDGKLTQDELNGARRDLLKKHDADGDGKLSIAEYEKLWLEFMHRRMVRGFQRTDRDGDSQITIEEFLKPFSRAVQRLDRNDDGVLDEQDKTSRGWRHGHGGTR